MASATASPLDELIVPDRWALTPGGMSCDGLHALDFQVGLGADGSVVVADARLSVTIPPEPEDWHLGRTAWAIGYLESSGARLGGQVETLRTLLDDLYLLWDERFGAGSSPITWGMRGVPEDVQELVYLLRQYLWLTDTDYIYATLAAAVAQAHQDADPHWLMLVAASSSGKGEALRLLDDVRHAAINDVTLAGLMGRGNKGMLPPLKGGDALAVITDFSSLLGDNRKSGETKGEVFNALRDIYDGRWRRDINPEPLEWHGRLSLVAACTPAIDSFTAHGDALGTRWVYFRFQDASDTDMRAMSREVWDREALTSRRSAARVKATEVINAARLRLAKAEVPEALGEVIADAATLVCYGRASVPRDYRQEVDGVVSYENPGRVTAQLRLLALGLVALGLSDEIVIRVVRRAATSSMPQARARVLAVLADADGDEPVSEWRISKLADLNLRVAQRALEDWELVHLAESEPITNERGVPATGWRLTELGRALGRTKGSDSA